MVTQAWWFLVPVLVMLLWVFLHFLRKEPDPGETFAFGMVGSLLLGSLVSLVACLLIQAVRNANA